MMNTELESQEMRVVTNSEGEKTYSKLIIPKANPRHSGNYTCEVMYNDDPDSVQVIVSTGNGENRYSNVLFTVSV